MAQPLIVAASLLSWGALADRGGFAGVAGHSVGEFAAAAAAGVLSEEDALRLVGIRGRAMAEAAAVEQTGMSAIIGGDEAVNVARLAELGPDTGELQRRRPARRCGRAGGARRPSRPSPPPARA